LILTYANQLTILRMAFIPCFVLLTIYGHARAAAIVFILAGITDGLDGLVARKLEQKTLLGSYLDPMADKLLLTAAFVTLTIPSVPVSFHLPIWFTVTTLSRDVLIALIALIIHLRTGHTHFPPSFPGKCATAAQLLTVGSALVGNLSAKLVVAIFKPMVYSTFFLTVTSGLHYLFRSVKLIESYQAASDGQKRDQDS
jgi:cardiolipin synthase (CMP-forming)